MKFPIYLLQLKLNEINALLERTEIDKRPLIEIMIDQQRLLNKMLTDQQRMLNEAITILKNHKDGSKDLQRTGE